MTFRFEARESVGYAATWTIKQAGAAVDITGWTFAATFERQAGAPDFALGMAPTAADEGFRVHDGPAGQLSVLILAETLQDIDDTTGLFTLRSDLLADPPDGPRQFVRAIEAKITKGPTP